VNSIIIGIGVVAVSVAGLAASIIMSQIHHRARGLFYLVTISPLLTPGVIIGIRRSSSGRTCSASPISPRRYSTRASSSPSGQRASFSAYCLLIFMARLTRFDRAQEEAALDLGASYPQVFWHILLPFLKPAIASAVVIGFLSSFENYNTTTFAILADKTLVTVLAGQVRQGTTPALSALAVISSASRPARRLREIPKRRGAGQGRPGAAAGRWRSAATL
jgi:spermidine/putrescine transport system permease protein